MVSKASIPSQKIPFLDANGNVSIPWYKFLFESIGGGSNLSDINDLLLSQSTQTQLSSFPLEQEHTGRIVTEELLAEIDEIKQYLSAINVKLIERVADINRKIEELSSVPPSAALNDYLVAQTWKVPPSIKTEDSTVKYEERVVVCDKPLGTLTLGLPDPISNVGEVIYFSNRQAQTVVSPDNNVIPLGGGSAGTAILPATVGSTCAMVADGQNWVIFL